MDLRQAMKWRPDNAYRAARCRPAVATPRSSGSPQPMQIDWPRSGQIYRALLTGQRQTDCLIMRTRAPWGAG
jgi:hypothetical protein